jgi:diguanylate cyclase (GGDEF)-like protein
MQLHDSGDPVPRWFQTQLLELERDRSQARDRADLLERLHQAFTDIALTRSPTEILDRTLRAARDPLGFSRAIFFSIEPPAGLTARRVLDGNDTVEPCEEPAVLGPGNALTSVAFGDGSYDTGVSTDLSAPLVDCRRWYVLTRIERARRTAGLLYVDGHPQPEPHDPVCALVPMLAAIAAVAIDNSTLFLQTQQLAERDPLTGLLNRRAFAERVNLELERCRRERLVLTYVVVDIDDFKGINDAKGHAFGDVVLTRVAQTLTRAAGPAGVVGRFAGDEFVVALGSADATLAYALVARLSSELRSAGLRCSIGAALFPRHAGDGPGLFAAADRALYASKAAGKNGFSFA